MKTFFKLGFISLLLQSSHILSNEVIPVDTSNLEKFFQPIELDLQDKLFEDNKFSLKEATYFGKRHRIVKANLDLLADDGQIFIINPFEDINIVVKTKEIINYQNSLSQRWTVEKIDSRIDIDDPLLTKELKDQLNTMSLNIRSFRHEKYYQDIQNIKGNAISSDPYKERIQSKLYVSGQLTDLNNHYRVLPVDSSAEFYLVIELDPKKKLIRGDSEAAQHRRNAHTEFSKQLKLEKDRLKNENIKQGGSK